MCWIVILRVVLIRRVLFISIMLICVWFAEQKFKQFFAFSCAWAINSTQPRRQKHRLLPRHHHLNQLSLLIVRSWNWFTKRAFKNGQCALCVSYLCCPFLRVCYCGFVKLMSCACFLQVFWWFLAQRQHQTAVSAGIRWVSALCAGALSVVRVCVVWSRVFYVVFVRWSCAPHFCAYVCRHTWKDLVSNICTNSRTLRTRAEWLAH